MKVNQFILIAILLLMGSRLPGQRPITHKDSLFNITEGFLKAAEKEIIVLQKKISESPDDTTKVILLNEVASIYCNLHYDSAVYYAQKANALACLSDFPGGVVISQLKRGYAEEVLKRDWDSAVFYYRKAIETARQNKLSGMMDDLYSVIHNAYVYQGNFPQAMSIANEGLEAAKKRGDGAQMVHYTSLVAAAYFRQDIYPQALATYRKAEAIAVELKEAGRNVINPVALADIYYGLGNVYAATHDTLQAMQYLEKAHNEFIVLGRNPAFLRTYMIANTQHKKGLLYFQSGNYLKSYDLALMALNFCKERGCNPYERTGYCLLAGDALRMMHEYDKAKLFLYEAKKIAEEIRHAENARDAYYYLSLFYADKKIFDSAWFYNSKYVVLKDSITNERTRFRTEEINVIYGTAEKDRKIARQTNLRNILIASFVVLLLTLGFGYNRYQLRQRNRYQQELNRQQNELFNAISLAQEQERKRMAQDIHDGLGSVLSAAKLKMAEVKELKPDLNTDEKFSAAINLVDEASAELRSISHNIMPATLSKLGLIPALKNLADKLSSSRGLQVQFIAHDFVSRPDEQTEISIYRIVLELINNVVKHAGATRATVQLVKYPDYINITVEDNGKGFDIHRAVDEKAGIGLASVAARVEYLKGKMHIDSGPGKGTTVFADIPATG